MKKLRTVLIALIGILFLFLMFGCSDSTDDKNITLGDCGFKFNEGTKDYYSLSFSVLNKNNESISTDVDVDIQIVNEEGEEVYKSTKSVSKDDFTSYIYPNYYTNTDVEVFLADLRIPAEDIISGKSPDGTVYLTVYKNDTEHSSEVSCRANNCLPVLDVNFTFDPFPLKIDMRGYDKSIRSTIQIDDITYSLEQGYQPKVRFTLSGSKIYDNSSYTYDEIGYKLYDSEEYLITSGKIYLGILGQGDKFKDDSLLIDFSSGIMPGETYKLVLSGYGS